MAKTLAEQIAEAKERRGQAILANMPEFDPEDDPGGWRAMREVAERHPDVAAIEAEIRDLRARQAAHGEGE